MSKPSSAPIRTGVSLGESRYQMIPVRPPIAEGELESRSSLHAEIVVLWGGNVLSVSHQTLCGSFSVGEPGRRSSGQCDLFLPAQVLGATRRVVAVGNRCRLSAVIPAGVRGHLTLPTGERLTLQEASRAAESAGERTVSGVEGGQRIPLVRGCRAHLFYGEIEIQIAAVSAARLPALGWRFRFDPTVLAYLGLSALSFGGLLSTMALWVPPLGLMRDEQMSAEELLLIQQYLAASAERNKPGEVAVTSSSGEETELSANRKFHSEAAALPATSHRHSPRSKRGIRTAKSEPAVSERRAEILGARNSEMAILLGRMSRAGVPMWGLEASNTGEGDLFEDSIFGKGGTGALQPGGLVLSGTGSGAGGRGEGVALPAVGTFARGTGALNERTARRSNRGGVHRTRAPKLRRGKTSVRGRLPAETIRRTVRLQHPRLVGCYQEGLLHDPSLSGRANVRFVIGRQGEISSVDTAGSDLRAPVVLACIRRVFFGLSFPKPDGGPVMVQYPLSLQPD